MITSGNRNRVAAVTALVLSLLLHGVLLGTATSIRVTAFRPPAIPHAPAKRLRIQTTNIRDLQFPKNTAASQDPGDVKTMVFADQKDKGVRQLMEKLNLAPALTPEVRITGLGQNVLAPKPQAPPPPQMPVAPPIKILEIDAQKLAADRVSAERALGMTEKVARQELLGDRVPGFTGVAGAGTGGRPDTVDLSMRLSGLSVAPLRPEELAKLQNRAEAGPIAPLDAAVLPGTPETSGRLEGLVTVKLTVYEPERGNGIFRIDIAPNTAAGKLRAVPKDILFLLDCSASISAAKLSQFKQGTVEALQCLTPDDRFNVVAFRDVPANLFPTPVPSTPEHLAAAKAFVNRQERGGLTDVYGSLAPYVQADKPPDPYRPLNVFLLSDGKSTVRNRLDNDTFIREVVKLRQTHVSIYSFTAGENANLFLMDLLAYTNRGGSVHVENVSRFAPDLVEFIRTHSDLIVADLRYRATGDLAKEIYPKQLPQLYRGETLSIYGSYSRGTEVIGVQIVGRDAAGQEQELVFRGNLRTAPRAGSQLAVDWASQKIFYLLAERVYNPAPEIAAEIRRLAEQYKLFIPYM